MPCHRLAGLLVALLAADGLAACSKDSPVAPGADHHQVSAAVAPAALEPFLVRATLDPYRIQDLPNFMIHSKASSDFIVQQSMFTGTGPWHTHPGLSYAYVLQGHIKLQKFNRKEGCFETPVFGPGELYIKPPNELHRAIVVGDEPEWELIVRLDFPVGGPIATPADDPGC